jgi:hypothetical protein
MLRPGRCRCRQPSNSSAARDLQHLEAASDATPNHVGVRPPCATKTSARDATRQSPVCAFSVRCAIGRTGERERETRTPDQGVAQQAGSARAGNYWLVVCPSPREASDRGSLVKPRPLTCWQSGPQRLVKRPCHAHAAHRQKRGFFDDSLLARRRTTRIGPCRDVRDGIGHCTHSGSSNTHTSPTLETHQRRVSRLACKEVDQVAPAALGRRIAPLGSQRPGHVQTRGTCCERRISC